MPLAPFHPLAPSSRNVPVSRTQQRDSLYVHHSFYRPPLNLTDHRRMIYASFRVFFFLFCKLSLLKPLFSSFEFSTESSSILFATLKLPTSFKLQTLSLLASPKKPFMSPHHPSLPFLSPQHPLAKHPPSPLQLSVASYSISHRTQWRVHSVRITAFVDRYRAFQWLMAAF